ncbi:unnamed protein product [Cochlearia groenlandica]
MARKLKKQKIIQLIKVPNYKADPNSRPEKKITKTRTTRRSFPPNSPPHPPLRRPRCPPRVARSARYPWSARPLWHVRRSLRSGCHLFPGRQDHLRFSPLQTKTPQQLNRSLDRREARSSKPNRLASTFLQANL